MRKIKNVYIRYTFIENKERRVTCLFAFSISIPSRRSQVRLPYGAVQRHWLSLGYIDNRDGAIRNNYYNNKILNQS